MTNDASGTNEDFNVPIPTDELDRPAFEPLAVGWYSTTLQSGAQIVAGTNSPSWKGLRVPFSGFTSKKDGKVTERDRNYQITIASDNPEAKRIGRQQLTGLAAAFGLTEDVTTTEGKPGKRMTASTPEELVEQLNAVAGSPVDAYVVIKKRKRGKEVVMRDDGKGPVLDNEVSRVAAFGEGK